jgi:hypothetical protein
LKNRKWVQVPNPNDKYSGSLVLGDREVELPPDAIISVTRLENMSLWRTILNFLLTLLVMKQMRKNEGLLYAELTGNMKGGGGNTLSVWKSREMIPFRDSGSHRFSMKFFRWIFSGKVQSYFLTWKANGHIPTYEEATAIVKKYGKHYDGNSLVRKASRPKIPPKDPNISV